MGLLATRASFQSLSLQQLHTRAKFLPHVQQFEPSDGVTQIQASSFGYTRVPISMVEWGPFIE